MGFDSTCDHNLIFDAGNLDRYVCSDDSGSRYKHLWIAMNEYGNMAVESGFWTECYSGVTEAPSKRGSVDDSFFCVNFDSDERIVQVHHPHVPDVATRWVMSVDTIRMFQSWMYYHFPKHYMKYVGNEYHVNVVHVFEYVMIMNFIARWFEMFKLIIFKYTGSGEDFGKIIVFNRSIHSHPFRYSIMTQHLRQYYKKFPSKGRVIDRERLIYIESKSPAVYKRLVELKAIGH